MPLYRVTVSIPHVNGLPQDVVVNNFHFDSIVAADFQNVVDMLSDFYTADPGDLGPALIQFYSDRYGTSAIVRFYNLADPEPRVPAFEGSFEFAPDTGGTPMPAEVALVLSFGAAPESGTIKARRRNRIYLGPFNTSACGASGQPIGTLTGAVAQAAGQMLEASDVSTNWNWVGYSPTDETQFVLAGGFVDNAWDTQRRRGEQPTDRTFFAEGTP